MVPLPDSEARILIVEENEYHGLLMERGIARRLDGSLVALARSADEAMRLARQQPFDIAVVDFVLADRDGLGLLCSLHQLDPDLAIIVITEDLSESIAKEVFRCGCQELLIKDSTYYAVVPRMAAGLYQRQRLRRQAKHLIGGRGRIDMRRSRQRFPADLCHELKGPLETILRTAKQILDDTGLEDNDLTERIRAIQDSAMRISSSFERFGKPGDADSGEPPSEWPGRTKQARSPLTSNS
jgi:ActR/RegA family two-component response regulator